MKWFYVLFFCVYSVGCEVEQKIWKHHVDGKFYNQLYLKHWNMTQHERAWLDLKGLLEEEGHILTF